MLLCFFHNFEKKIVRLSFHKTLTLKFFFVVVFVAVFVAFLLYFWSVYQNKQQASFNKRHPILEMMQIREFETLLLLRDYNYLDSLYQQKTQEYEQLTGDYYSVYRQFIALVGERKNLQQQIKNYQDRIQFLLNEIFILQQQIHKLSHTLDSVSSIMQYYVQLHSQSTSATKTEHLREMNLIFMKSQPAVIKNRSGQVVFTKNRKKANVVIITFDITSPSVQFDLGLSQVYFRIADPNGNILPYSESEPSFFEFNGESILFSHVEEIVFSSEMMPLRVIYRPIWPLQPGIYWVYAFCDGVRIAESSFEVH